MLSEIRGSADVRCQQYPLNDNSFYTTWPILTKLQGNVPKVTLYRISYKKFDPSKNVAAKGRGQFPLCTCGKTFKIFSETSGQNCN